MKILVFSLEEGIRESVKFILGDHYDMILTDSLEQCQECIKNSDISTLIFDVDKQDDPLKDIKNLHSNHPNLKIVGLGRNKEVIQSLEDSGASSIILKPFNSNAVLDSCS